MNCLNASTLLAALAPSRIGFHERPHDVTTWAKLLHTAQLEVQGELLSLAEMEQVGVPILSNHGTVVKGGRLVFWQVENSVVPLE